MIRFATTEMEAALKKLWAACFGDERAYIDYLFDRLLRAAHVLVSTDEGGAPVAMLCLEPFTLASTAGDCEGAYIYGVATLPKHRGKGLSSALLENCHARLRGDGFALSALVPADEGLFRFYGERGYETAFEVVKADVAGADLPSAGEPCVLTPARFGDLAGLRDNFYADRARFVRWRPDYLAYIGGECELLGGEVLRLSCGGETGYAVCYRGGGTVFVKELALPVELLGDAVAAIHARYGEDRYRLYLPADTLAFPSPDLPNKVLPFAMVRWYDKEKQETAGAARGKAPWIAHVLD